MGTDQRDVYKQSNWPCNRLCSDRGDLLSRGARWTGTKGGVSGFMAGGKSLVFAAADSLAAPKSLGTVPNLTVNSFFYDEKPYPLTNYFILTLLFLFRIVGLKCQHSWQLSKLPCP